MAYTKNDIQEAFDALEEQGLIRKSGELRGSQAGDLQPVYIATAVAKWLNETGLLRDFEEYRDRAAAQNGLLPKSKGSSLNLKNEH